MFLCLSGYSGAGPYTVKCTIAAGTGQNLFFTIKDLTTSVSSTQSVDCESLLNLPFMFVDFG